MLKRTISEEQFEAFCQHRGIPIEPIPESDTLVLVLPARNGVLLVKAPIAIATAKPV